MSTLFHMAKPPMPEQQNQSGWSWPTPHCKGAHLDPSVLGEPSVKQIHSAQCTQHSRRISCHLHKESCHLWFCFVPGFSGWGFSISTNSPGSAPGGDSSSSTTAAVLPKGTSSKGQHKFPCPCVHMTFSSFADAQISLKSEQKGKVDLAENSC